MFQKASLPSRSSSGIWKLETKGFSNPGRVFSTLQTTLSQSIPGLSPQQCINIAQELSKTHYNIIAENTKSGRPFAHLHWPLPKWTQWSDVTLHIRSFLPARARSSEVNIIVKGVTYPTSFFELLFDDAVGNVISVSGKILFHLALWGEFRKDNDIDWIACRKQKDRLSKELKNFFGFDENPFILNSKRKRYMPKFHLEIEKKSILQGQYSVNPGDAVSFLLEKYQFPVLTL